ncbi:YdbL family protein [Photobacterium atrarenae]|uniref:YdbL family protein n=1 Tax=Photobacterium atrarenae TaxID=865757 RepID=A0ABY5GL28_9GAMM|nr:YdbL family protein [Photobacterium atrarenae]UTV30020.1 YdbL family protein [Photobacterium atrarenae]
MKKIVYFLFALCLSFNAYALDLQQAKDQGLVGEANTGYIAPVTVTTTSEVRQLVSSVNRIRKANYQRIAVSNGLTTEEVGRLAYQKAIRKTEPGHYVQNAAGAWVRK